MQEAQAKMAEIQQQLGGRELTQENYQQLEQQKAQQSQAKEDFLQRICTPEAHDRLNRVGLVKKELAEKVKMQLIKMAQSGQLNSKVDDEQVKRMLESATEAKAAQKIVIKRTSVLDSDDDDDDSDLL